MNYPISNKLSFFTNLNARWAVSVFGSNLNDEKYLEEVIPAPEFGGSFDHPGSQRRYGVELQFRF